MSALSPRANIAGTPSNATAKTALTSVYDFVAQRLAAGTTNAGTASATDLQLARETLQLGPAQMSNLWINSDFSVNQRGLTTAADGAYCLDQTYVLTESGSCTVAQLAQPTEGIPYALRLTQPDASPKRIGFAQAVEARNCLAYRGKNLVFAPKLRSSAAGDLRVALLAHTGTADTITRDVINTWASATFTPGNFFIASNLSVIATGAVTVAANTWTDVPISSTSSGGVAAPSAMTNLIMVVWTDAQQAQNATLDASVIRAGLGAQVPIWVPPDAQQELARCERYCEKSYTQGTPVPTTSGLGRYFVPAGAAVANGSIWGFVAFRAKKRAAPTVTTYSLTSATANAGTNAAGADLAADSAAPYAVSETGFALMNSSGGNITPSAGGFQVHWLAVAPL